MKPVYLSLENFMNHLYSEIDCSLFDSVLIVGKNKNNDRESNGLGKSTIFNAIEYALFNATPPKLSLDDIIHDKESKCKVVFIFETTNGTFRVTRSRGKTSDVKLEELIGEKWVSRAGKTPTTTDKAIRNIIGINHKTFKYSVLFAQGDEFGLASATPENRRGILKEPLNLNSYGKYEKVAKELAREKQIEFDKLQEQIELLGDPNTDVEATELSLNSTNDSIKRLNDNIKKERSRIEQKRSLLSGLQNTISYGDASILDKLNNIKYNINNINSNIKSLRASIQDAERKKSFTESRLEEDSNELKLLENIINSLNNIDCRTEENIKADLKKVKDNELKGIKYIAKLEAQESELEEFLLPDSDECPYCKQKITDEHREACTTQINKDLDKIRKDLDTYRPKLDFVVERKNIIEKELTDLVERQTKISRTNNQIASKKDDINSKHKMIEQLDDILSNHNEMYNNSKAELDELLEQENSFQSMADRAIKEQAILKNINDIQAEIKLIDALINKDLEEVAERSSLKGALEEKLKIRKEDKKKFVSINKKIKTLENELITHKRVIQAFGSTGIPSMIISTILDDLQIEANDLLNQIKPELELQFHIEKEKKDGQQAETLDISYRIHGRDRTYYQLSGAQKLVVALSLKLGLSRVIQHRLGVDIKFLALDEVDQSLDEAGIEAFFNVIKEWEKKFKIFVITHNNTLKYKFKHIIEVVGDMENGVHASVVAT